MIVVTGGAGFIGSNLVASLSDRGTDDVVVCDRFGCDDKWRNLAKHEIAEFVTPEGLLPFLDQHRGQIDVLFHLGAVSSTTESDVDLIIDSNVRFSMQLWRWCAANNTRFIYASSAATYGDGSQGFDDDDSLEALAKLRPLNAYGWSKHVFDRRLARLKVQNVAGPPQCIGLKFFNVYGPNEYHKQSMQSIIAKMYPIAAAGQTVRLFRSHHPDYPDGGQMRDFVYVRDCVDVMMWMLDTPSVNGLFNIGTGQACSFQQFVNALFVALGLEPAIEYVDTPVHLRDKYQYFTQANIQRLRAAGYVQPMTPPSEGVSDYVHRYLATSDPYR